MKISLERHGLGALVFALCSLLCIAHAQVVIDVQLGNSFTGTIATAGVDTVEARFSAASGTQVRLAVQAIEGSTLEPTVVVRDDVGATVPIDSTQRIGWLPMANRIDYFRIPADGSYSVTIGGASGSGGFRAVLSGTGPPVVPGPDLVQLSGTVTNSLTAAPIAGVSVLADSSVVATTSAGGAYAAQLTPGGHAISFQATDYELLTTSVQLVAGTPSLLDVALVPTLPVVLDTSLSGSALPGAIVQASVTVTLPAGASVDSIRWTQISGAPATLSGATTDTVGVTLGSVTAFKDELIHVLQEPPVDVDQLPPNVPVPPGEFPAGLQDRFQVVGTNPLSLEEAGLVVLEVEVDTPFGALTEEVEIHTSLPWKSASGLRDVAQGSNVLLHAREQAGYDWVLSPPPGSLATLMDATTRNPYFVPDIPGVYDLEVTDETTGSPFEMEIFAGSWRGTIVDQDLDGRPIGDTACTFCHDGTPAVDKFTPWMASGHAEIFRDNLNTSTHYGESCFACHTVGFDPDSDNGGIDEADDYQDFLGSGMINHPGDNWTTLLEQQPETARFGNIQCENCHGPQDSLAHGFGSPLGDPRVGLSSDVCAVCHGEPARHARFQQWQFSGHANYELAIDEGSSGNCARCHTANGFLAWLPVLLDDDPATDPLDNVTVTWTPEETHPQTCVTCHDPHAEGTTSGDASNATVRISGDTPPLTSGFQVTGAGRAAICMTCHNSRRGLRNDSTFDALSASDKARAPHGAAQTDLLLGQNVYLTDVDAPGGHAGLSESCVRCHMSSTPPPAPLSYNQGGTNHTFFASKQICAECHSPRLTAADVQSSIQFLLDQVSDLWTERTLELMESLTDAGNRIDLNGDITLTGVGNIASLEFGESHGRHAITVTLTTGEAFGPHAVTDVDVLDGSSTVIGDLYSFADDRLKKAGWNWNMVHNDGSLGVHNPIFAADALTAARNALVALGTGATTTPDAIAPSRTPQWGRWSQRDRPARGVGRDPGGARD